MSLSVYLWFKLNVEKRVFSSGVVNGNYLSTETIIPAQEVQSRSKLSEGDVRNAGSFCRLLCYCTNDFMMIQ